MPPTGSDKPVIYILGDSPGRSDDELGRQFAGAAGEEVRDRLPSKWAKAIRWNNVIRCRAQGQPEPLEIECCRSLQVADIEQTKPKVIIGFGQAPLAWALQPYRLRDWRGRRVPIRVGQHVCWF